MGMLNKPGKKCPQCNGTGVKNARSNVPMPAKPAGGGGAAPKPTRQAEKCPKCAGKGVMAA